MTDAEFLRAIGEALYGPQWQSALARDLDVSDRTMRRWLSGGAPLPAGLADDLLRLCDARIGTLSDLRVNLIAAAHTTP